MDIKNLTSLRTSLETSYNNTSDIDISEGTPEREMFIEAPIQGQLLEIWDAIQYLNKLQAPFLYSNDLLTEDLDVYCRNHDVSNIPATYSTGELTFYTYNEPSKNIILDPTHSASTGEQDYTITGYYVLPYADKDSYYNTTEKRWEITCRVRANTAGPDGTTGVGTITTLLTAIPGIEGCVNNSPITGGLEEGTISERLNKVKRQNKGRTLGPIDGIRLFVEGYSSYVNIVGANDPLMLRTEGLGGGVDIYIRSSEIEGALDTVTLTSTGLSGDDVDSTYTESSIILSNQPVSSIALVTKNGTVLDQTYYSLYKDTGVLRKSTRAQDALQLTSTGLIATGLLATNDVVEIRYNYNKLLSTIEAELNSTSNLYDNRDCLLREQEDVIIDVYMKVKLYTGAALATVKSTSSLNISSYMTAFDGDAVELIDILSIVKNTTGVDNIDTPSALLTPRDGRQKTTSGDVPIGNNEYPVLGTLSLVLWS